MSDLKGALTDIDGVGDKTADKILNVVAEFDTSEPDPLVEKAKEAAREGDDRRAAIMLRRSDK
ncbi:hypothetical protein HFTV1-gp14 [Haloferax tailed virus 1]|uniref:Uncharacterized protein n=1 Tax=Haloferax tailed virus 1 TaxID=2507575 RepID=A0A410N6R1_HFTV1|nr:hypothetical protein M1M17_gp14 [Haloferax tailed virus 1]QAS68847.1 hypothetical protein HFTV1-gp14 [Haloferax tailed virus 1]